MDLAPNPGGHVLVGLDRPDAVLAGLGAHGTDDGSYVSPVFVLEPDAGVAESGACREIGAHPRVRLFAGPGCERALLESLRGGLDGALPNRFHVSGPRTAVVAKAAADGLRRLMTEQADATRAVRARLDGIANGRGAAYWAERYRAIRDGSSPRVLVVTSLFTTFLRYSAEDLAGAFGEHGADARLLMERDHASVLTPIAVMREIERFDPDLIVVINYTRNQRAEMFPKGWPYVCWVQDAMNHMFQKSAGGTTELDFLAGHIYSGSGMIEGYAEDAVLEFPVPVSEQKFFDAPISDTERERFACDIAYVSHQSETAERFHDRLVREFEAAQRGVFTSCLAAIRGAVDDWASGPQEGRLERALEDLVAGLGRKGDRNAQDVMRTQYVYPITERLLRHQSLEWAGGIAERHNLDLRIFGNGWDAHPTLHRYAHGAVEHGESLRACYSAGAVQLHVSALGCGHQRVVECAFSGGLPLCRRSWDEQYRYDWLRMTEFERGGHVPDATLVKWKWPAFAIDNHPELEAIINDRARMVRPELGWNHEHFEGVYARIGNDPYFKYWDGPIPPEQMRPLALLGDPLELTFSTETELESLVLRATRDAAWRRDRSAGIAGRARATVSMDCFAKGMLDLVGDRLCAHTTEPIGGVAARV